MEPRVHLNVRKLQIGCMKRDLFILITAPVPTKQTTNQTTATVSIQIQN
jgi:hypothetical protein